MSNNPPLPPPNMDDFEATMIREQNPPLRPRPSPRLPDPGQAENERYNKPRRAKEKKPRNPIWTYIALGGYFAAAGFIGGFLGTLLANIL